MSSRSSISTSANRSSVSSVRSRILLGSLVQFAGKGGSALVAVALVAVLTRYLGLSSYGRYGFVIAYISLFYIVIDLGSQAIAVREMAQLPEQRSAIAGQLLTIKLVLAGIGLVTTLVIAWLGPEGAFRQNGTLLAVLVAGAALLAVPFSAAAGAVYQTTLRMVVPSLGDVSGRLVSLILAALLAIGVFGPRDASSRFLAAIFITTIGGWFGAMIAYAGVFRIVPVRPRLDISIAGPMVRDALPLAIVSILGIIHYRLDVFVLSAMKPMAVVGTYNLAVKVLDVAMAGGAVFVGMAFPVISSRVHGDRAVLKRTFQRSFDFVLMAGMGGAVATSLLAPLVVRILGGSQFHGSVVPVALIAWAIPLTFANLICSYMLIAANQQRRAVPIPLIATALNLALNVALIPRMGASAPALVTVLTEGFNAAGIAWLMSRYYRFRPSYRSLGCVALAAILAAGAFAAVQFVTWIAAIVVAGMVYISVLWVTHMVQTEDVTMLLQRYRARTA